MYWVERMWNKQRSWDIERVWKRCSLREQTIVNVHRIPLVFMTEWGEIQQRGQRKTDKWLEDRGKELQGKFFKSCYSAEDLQINQVRDGWKISFGNLTEKINENCFWWKSAYGIYFPIYNIIFRYIWWSKMWATFRTMKSLYRTYSEFWILSKHYFEIFW